MKTVSVTGSWRCLRPVFFPAFQDRASDVHHVLYYQKNQKISNLTLLQMYLAILHRLLQRIKKTTFQSLVSDTLGEDCDYDTVRNIHDNLNELMEEAKESPDPLELSRPDVKHLLERSGVPEEKMEHFDKNFEEAVGEKNTLPCFQHCQCQKLSRLRHLIL